MHRQVGLRHVLAEADTGGKVDAADLVLISQPAQLHSPEQERELNSLSKASARYRANSLRRAFPASATGSTFKRVQKPGTDRDQMAPEHARRQQHTLARPTGKADWACAGVLPVVAYATSAAVARAGRAHFIGPMEVW